MRVPWCDSVVVKAIQLTITVKQRDELEDAMERRKIRDETDARACLAAAKKSGLTLARWGRSVGVDGRSLHAWSMNLARGGSGPRRKRARGPAAAKRVELVELVATRTCTPRTAARCVVRVGQVGIEIGEDFDAATT